MLARFMDHPYSYLPLGFTSLQLPPHACWDIAHPLVRRAGNNSATRIGVEIRSSSSIGVLLVLVTGQFQLPALSTLSMASLLSSGPGRTRGQHKGGAG